MALLICLVSVIRVDVVQAKFGVQLPFLDGHGYRCAQNWNGNVSHQYNSTKYDLDFGMPRGTLLVAASGGKVIAIQNNCREGSQYYSCGHGFGNYIKIKNYNEENSLLYAHLQYHGVLVNVGDDVNAGQPIGFSGNTGHSTGPHVHFGLHDIDNAKPGRSLSDIEIWSHDKNTGEDLWRLVGVPRNNSKAFRCYVDGNDIGHEYEAMDINGFNFSAFQCSDIGNNSIHCWRGDKDSTGRYHSAWCEDALFHIRYYKNNSGYHSEELSTADGRDLCGNNQGEVGLLAFLSDGSYGMGGGLPPVSGDKTDLTPDFDIYNTQGQEISSNHSDDPIKTVYVGQQVRLNLTTEVHNDDTENHLRDDDSDSIEGPVYYWIEGVIPKTLYVSEEFDVDDLDKGDEPDEEEWFIIPNYPGHIISFQAEVDGDDEVDEESEDNNTSRVERLQIVENPNNSNNQPGSSVGIVLSPEEIMSILFN